MISFIILIQDGLYIGFLIFTQHTSKIDFVIKNILNLPEYQIVEHTGFFLLRKDNNFIISLATFIQKTAINKEFHDVLAYKKLIRI